MKDTNTIFQYTYQRSQLTKTKCFFNRSSGTVHMMYIYNISPNFLIQGGEVDGGYKPTVDFFQPRQIMFR